MDQNAISRKKFLGMSAAATGAALFSGVGSSAMTELKNEDKTKADLKEYILSNVRLEEGFEYNEKKEVVSTKTDLYNLHIANGKI